MTGGHHLQKVYVDRNGLEYGEQTPMGGMSLGARTGMFVFLSLLTMAVLGGGYVYVDRTLGHSVDQLIQARELADLTIKVDRGLWRIANSERAFLVDHDPRYREHHDAEARDLTRLLDHLLARSDAAPTHKRLDAVQRGLVQHKAALSEVAAAIELLETTGTEGIGPLVERAARDLEALLAGTKVPGLASTMERLRETEYAILDGNPALDAAKVRLQENMDVFATTLASAPLPEKEKVAAGELLIAYGSVIEVAAKARELKAGAADRLGGIIADMQDQVAAIVSFAEEKTVLAAQRERAVREVARHAVAAGSAGALFLVMLFGAVLMRSVTNPVKAIARATGRILSGDDTVTIPALGNHDEVGEVARTLAHMRTDLAETSRLRKDVEVAMTEVALRLDETIGLRREIEALKNEAEKHAVAEPVSEPVPEPATLRPHLDKLWSGSISSMSETVQLSSRDVLASAFEAERTGTMICGLNGAAERLKEVEGLLVTIAEQSNFLTFKTDLTEGSGTEANRNLIVLSSNYRSAAENGAAEPVGPKTRLDAIRTATTQTGRLIKDVTETLAEIKDAAVDLATATSEEAVMVTSRLMEQSEQLHSMLDDLMGGVKNRDDAALGSGKPVPRKGNGPEKT